MDNTTIIDLTPNPTAVRTEEKTSVNTSSTIHGVGGDQKTETKTTEVVKENKDITSA